MANRLLISSLTKKLSSLEKTANFPRKPNITPSALYVQDVLNPVNLPPPGKGSPREFYLKEIHKRVNAAWSNMDPSLKAAYEKQSVKSKEKFSAKVEQWYTENGEAEICKEIKLVRDQIEVLKNPPTK
eukprot:TRINITY_DN16097_c0_g1_i1.p1 TRINITY_DN16097_c0_g1~~TRINITY_DN16097_c0_g1_i1.p1  ORF type:complete len:128 (+),score=33.78 TRINITY_DN16097_c0_g1_i1:35-418(+)